MADSIAGKIDQLFQKARKRAWASIMRDPEIAALIKEQRDAKLDKGE